MELSFSLTVDICSFRLRVWMFELPPPPRAASREAPGQGLCASLTCPPAGTWGAPWSAPPQGPRLRPAHCHCTPISQMRRRELRVEGLRLPAHQGPTTRASLFLPLSLSGSPLRSELGDLVLGEGEDGQRKAERERKAQRGGLGSRGGQREEGPGPGRAARASSPWTC